MLYFNVKNDERCYKNIQTLKKKKNFLSECYNISKSKKMGLNVCFCISLGYSNLNNFKETLSFNFKTRFFLNPSF